MDIGLSSPIAPVRSSVGPVVSGVRMPMSAVPLSGNVRERAGLRSSLAEGALLLVAVYSLIGAGLGDAFDRPLLGFLVGAVLGCCAIAAILLISGAALGADATRRPVARWHR